MNIKAIIAELIGTFALTFTVLISINMPGVVATPVAAALTVGLFVYLIGPVSGAHINPAVTIGMLLLKKVSVVNGVGYIVAQFLGAFVACFLLNFYGAIPTELAAQSSQLVTMAEIIGAVILVLGVSSVVLEAVPASASGLVIGTALLIGITFAAPLSNGVLNPAVAFGIGSFSVSYIVGPIVGGVIGALLGNMLHNSK